MALAVIRTITEDEWKELRGLSSTILSLTDGPPTASGAQSDCTGCNVNIYASGLPHMACECLYRISWQSM